MALQALVVGDISNLQCPAIVPHWPPSHYQVSMFILHGSLLLGHTHVNTQIDTHTEIAIPEFT